MEFEHDIVYLPDQTQPKQAKSLRTLTLETSSNLDRETLAQKAHTKAATDGVIDAYALRNYWRLGGGRTRLTDTSWQNPSHLMHQLNGYDQVLDVDYSENAIERVVIIDAKPNDIPTLRNKLEADYGSELPLEVQGDLMAIHLEYVWPYAVSSRSLTDVI